MNNRVSRFVAVGISNTILDFTLLNILVFVFNLPSIPANIISATLAMTWSYVLNHGFVFKSEHSRSPKQFVLFISITAFGLLVVQNGIIYLLGHVFTLPSELIYKLVNAVLPNVFSEEFIRLNFAKVVATLTTMVWNYQLYKRLIFKQTEEAKED